MFGAMLFFFWESGEPPATVWTIYNPPAGTFVEVQE